MKEILHAADCDCAVCLIKWYKSEINIEISIMNSLIKEFQIEMKDEMKDFHARLCIIEERNKK